MNSREAILKRVRSRLQGVEVPPLPAPESIPAHFGLGPNSSQNSDLESFRQMAESVGVEFHDSLSSALHGVKTAAVSDSAVVAKAIASALEQRSRMEKVSSTSGSGSRPGTASASPSEEIEVFDGWLDRSALLQADAGVTTAQFGIAETGTLVLLGDEEKHRLVSLVPPIHIALLSRNCIVPTIGSALQELTRDRCNGISPVTTFITGPSRTADIELQLVLGVHGPRTLRIVLV